LAGSNAALALILDTSALSAMVDGDGAIEHGRPENETQKAEARARRGRRRSNGQLVARTATAIGKGRCRGSLDCRLH